MKKASFLSIIVCLIFFVFSGSALAGKSDHDKDKDHDHKKAESKYSDLDRANKAGEIRGVFSRCDEQGTADTFAYIVGRSFSALLDADTGSFTLSYVPPGEYSLAFVQDGKVILFLDGVEVRKHRLTDVGTFEFCPDTDADGFDVLLDCNDNDPNSNPDAVEACGDDLDNNCDGRVDENCRPVDCQVSAWSSYSACSTTCGGGTQTRTRTITVQSENGGASCPATTDSRQCNTQPCATDQDLDGFDSTVDCNDLDLRINPNATEVCGDGIDNNCDAQVDENCGPQCAPHENICNDQCVDFSSDPTNCGGCRHYCTGSKNACISGTCQSWGTCSITGAECSSPFYTPCPSVGFNTQTCVPR